MVLCCNVNSNVVYAQCSRLCQVATEKALPSLRWLVKQCMGGIIGHASAYSERTPKTRTPLYGFMKWAEDSDNNVYMLARALVRINMAACEALAAGHSARNARLPAGDAHRVDIAACGLNSAPYLGTGLAFGQAQYLQDIDETAYCFAKKGPASLEFYEVLTNAELDAGKTPLGEPLADAGEPLLMLLLLFCGLHTNHPLQRTKVMACVTCGRLTSAHPRSPGAELPPPQRQP